jgi:uncharacterized MAPEG superfamily protein
VRRDNHNPRHTVLALGGRNRPSGAVLECPFDIYPVWASALLEDSKGSRSRDVGTSQGLITGVASRAS